METTAAIPPPPASANRPDRCNAATFKLLLIALLVVLLQIPTWYVNGLREERSQNRERAQHLTAAAIPGASPLEGYRITERALKHSVLILALVFAAFFLFEAVAGLRLHAVHYCLVGAALCLFYLALLALGEIWPPGVAYLAAAGASSLLIVTYSAAILRRRERAGIIALLLAAVFGVLYIVLRMEEYALLAGTALLFVALGAIMYFTRHVDWNGSDAAAATRP